MTNSSEYEPHGKAHPESIPTMENTHATEKRVGVVETVPVRRETVTTTTSHSHPTKRKEGYGPNPAVLGALLLAIPLAGILGYLIREPKVRVVTRTVTNTVPVLTVPASPVVTPAPVSPATSSSPVGPAVVGPSPVGPEIVGPARVGVDRVGNK